MTIFSSNDIRVALSANSLALSKARDDAALYDRLRAASAEATRLQKNGDALTQKLADALEGEAQRERERIAAQVRNIWVSTDFAPNQNGVLGAKFTIGYERLQWNSSNHVNEWTPTTVGGFAALGQEIMGYLINDRPDAIPALIMDLAPGLPSTAMELYFRAQRRGYVSSAN